MPTDWIKIIYDSEGFKKAFDEQAALGKAYDKTAKAQDKVSASGSILEKRLGKLQSFGRNLRQAGGFLGSDTIAALGDFADGMSDVGDSINTVTKTGGKLGKVLGVLGAVGGGVAAGASIYDATIGKLQGGNTAGNILDQLGQFAAAGFNQEQLAKNMAAQLSQMRFQVESAQISANNAIFDLKQSAMKNTPEANRALQGIFGAVSGSLPLVGGRYQQFSDVYGEAARKQQNAQGLRDQITRFTSMFTAGAGALQTSRSLAQRKTGASNMYQSALYAIEQDTGKRRAEIARTYAQSLIDFDKQYYLARQQAASQYGIETQRAEEAHQKDIRRMQEDHSTRLRKLADSRDALAIEDEIEDYERDRRRAEEDYGDAARMRNEDYARQMQEMEAAHQEQRNERQRAYQEQMRELQTQAQARRTEEYTQYSLLLRDIVTAFAQARRDFATSIGGVTNATTTNTVSVNQSFGGAANPFQMQQAIYDTMIKVFNKAMR